jgi:quinol-cytochrome oxidoreductase complex cytochrome b subunit
VTPPHIVPEWYFLPYYAILRAIPSKLFGVIAMFSAIGILLFVPWLDTSRVRSTKYRPLYRWFFWLFVFIRCASWPAPNRRMPGRILGACSRSTTGTSSL